METLSKKCIVDTVEACAEYSGRLNESMQAARNAQQQISFSSQMAKKQLESTFQHLTDYFTSCLNKRKEFILNTIEQFEKESIVPLKQCENDINSRKKSTEKLLLECQQVLLSGGFKSEQNYQNFLDQTAALGGLPAVPDLELLPNITFQASLEPVETTLERTLAAFSSVYKIGPVQLTSVEPRPGSLLVRWEEIDLDTDIHSYRLQLADKPSYAITKDESLFRDVYVGGDSSFVVRELKPGVDYALRVCCRANDRTDWTAWSRVKTGSTHLLPYTWDEANKHYIVSDGGKLARMVKPGVIYSSYPCIESGHSIQFTLMMKNSSKQEIVEGVALCGSSTSADLIQDGTLFISLAGNVFVDGKIKRIALPTLHNRDKITLHCDKLAGKWRVTIEVGDKGVTYDWSPASPSTRATTPASIDKLYFAAVFHQPETHIFVH